MQNDSPLRWVRQNVFKCTQEELAAIGGVSRPRVTRYETSDDQPSYEFLDRLRQYAKDKNLRLDMAWFFEVPADPTRPADEDYSRKSFMGDQTGALT